MRSAAFVAIVLVSGALAGLVHGGVNHLIVGPYLEDAIGIENQSLFEAGLEETPGFWAEHDSYRGWQQQGQIAAGVILGISTGSLFGIVYALSRHALPGDHDVKKACVLAGIMWLVVFLVPFLKYPANPPTVGDADTIVLRSLLYVGFVVISGSAAVGFYRLSKRLRGQKKLLSLAGYGALMAAAWLLMPGNPDEITAPADLMDGFRLASALGVSAFWATIPIILGALWHRFRPDEQIRNTH